METATRRLLDRVVRYLMTALPYKVVLTVMLAVRRVRANLKHITRAMAAFILIWVLFSATRFSNSYG